MKHVSPANSNRENPHSPQNGSVGKDRSFTALDKLAWAVMIIAGVLFIFGLVSGLGGDLKEKELRPRFVDN